VYTACYGLDMKYPPKGSWVEDWWCYWEVIRSRGHYPSQ
jgi:hypothetical protein